MKETDRKKRNDSRLLELYPTFRARLEKVIFALESKGIRPRIQDAWRSPADQEKAFRSGHSKLLFGFHNVTASNGTPEALAVDLLDDDSPVSPSKKYLLQLAAAAQAAGLVTGCGQEANWWYRCCYCFARLGCQRQGRLGPDACPTNRRYSCPGKSWQKAGVDRPTHALRGAF